MLEDFSAFFNLMIEWESLFKLNEFDIALQNSNIRINDVQMDRSKPKQFQDSLEVAELQFLFKKIK